MEEALEKLALETVASSADDNSNASFDVIDYVRELFLNSEEQKKLAQASKENLADSGKFKSPIVTEIVPATTFYRAEEYHQDYFKKQPFRYKNYSVGSGRAGFLKKTWDQPK